MFRFPRFAAATLLAWQALALTQAASAASDQPIISMQHVSWTAGDGAPTGVTAITQTPDGWLWISSSVGLFRFDGVRFQRASGAQAPLSSNIANMGVLPDGTLWVAYKFGGASLMKDGVMRHFRVGERKLPGGTLNCLAQDASGRVWMGTLRGLRWLGPNGEWEEPGASYAAPGSNVTDMQLDRNGAFWVRTTEAIYVLEKNGTRFEQRQPTGGYGVLAQHPDGSLWTSDTMHSGLHLIAGTSDSSARSIDDRISRFLFDHTGMAWMPVNSGVVRSQGAAVQRTGAEHGLSGMHGYAAFEDREQNIWIGTENGLDRFRDYQLRPLDLQPYLGGARPMAVRAQGGAWVDRSLLENAGAAPIQFAPRGSSADLTTALHEDANGVLWSGGIGGLWKISDGKREAVPMPPGLQDPMRVPVLSISSGAAGSLWVSLGRRGLYTLRDGQWQPAGGVPGLAGVFPTVMARDAQGGMWFGSTGNTLAMLDGTTVHHVGKELGLRVGTVLAILPTSSGAWIGGENGMAYFDGKRFSPVTGRGDDPFAGITGMVLDDDGTLWLNGGAGITSITSQEVKAALGNPAYRVQFRRFDYRDGLLGTASPITPFPSAIRSSDGALWFSTMGGVFTFNPATLARNKLVPPVYITGVKADGQERSASEGLRLDPYTSSLQVDFTALSYRTPERMNFRYQLEGVDRGWQDAAGRRSAHYTNLEPGSYRFRVIASNDEGVWNTEGATLSFELKPGATQTIWFKLLAGGAAAFSLWLLYRMRLRQVGRQLAAQMNERLAERERIARELHDTLLQSVYGLMMKFSNAALRLGPAERQPLEEALDIANQVLEEGRDRVAGLRGESLEQADLAAALREYGEPLARDAGVAFEVVTQGAVRALEQDTAFGVLAIAREAVWNALLHAKARSIRVTLDYAPRQLTLTVADDGCGMPDEVLRNGGRSGHWGIPGMRERAARLGTLALDSRQGAGTTWVLTIAC